MPCNRSHASKSRPKSENRQAVENAALFQPLPGLPSPSPCANFSPEIVNDFNDLSAGEKIPCNIKGLQVTRPVGKKRAIFTETAETLELTAETRRVLQGCGRLGCTLDEVAGVLQVTADGLEAFFRREPHARTLFKNSRMEGKVSLRRIQYSLAPKSAAMAIFLGKNELGQSDRQDIQHSGGMDVVVRVTKYEDPSSPDDLAVDYTIGKVAGPGEDDAGA